MGDGIGQIWPVERVEMKLVDAVGLKKADLFGGHRRGDHATGFRIVFDAFKHVTEPGRNGRAAHGGEFRRLRVVGNRHDARHDGRGDAGGEAPVKEAQVGRGVEEILRDGARGAGVQLAPEIIQIVAWASGRRMRLRKAATEISKSPIARRPATRSAA